MSVKIIARVITQNGVEDIIMPQTQNDFNQSLINTGFYNQNHNGYIIEKAWSGHEMLDRALAHANDIEELNYLAQILSHLDEDEMEKFTDILSAEGNVPSMRQVVNIAYNVNNINFNIEQSIYDVGDLGRAYAKDNDPEADEIILANTDSDGDVNYEGIGVDLQLKDGGVFSDSGYISNYDEMVSSPYDGNLFPPFCYSEEPFALGVTMTKRGEENGVDIFLPAENGIIRRAEQRIGARLDDCAIRLSWGFPKSLAGKIMPASEGHTLSAVAERLSVLTTEQLRDVFNRADKTVLESVQDFEEFCSEQIRELQMPDCPLIGADSNVFNLMGLVSRTLKQHGMKDQAQEMQKRVTSSGSFDEALAIMTEYVNPVSQEDMQQSGGFKMNM